jgi:hypothetical protein
LAIIERLQALNDMRKVPDNDSPEAAPDREGVDLAVKLASSATRQRGGSPRAA